MENFYEEIVKSLKEDANKLNKKLTTAIHNGEMNLYISTVKSLRDTLDLISKYDWKLMYSEYGVKREDGNIGIQVSVWEQNHNNQIKNHKIWDVVDAIKTITRETSETGNNIGEALKNVSAKIDATDTNQF